MKRKRIILNARHRDQNDRLKGPQDPQVLVSFILDHPIFQSQFWLIPTWKSIANSSILLAAPITVLSLSLAIRVRASWKSMVQMSWIPGLAAEPSEWHVYMYMYMCACMCVCVYVCMYVCMDGWMDGCMHVCIYCMYVCMYCIVL